VAVRQEWVEFVFGAYSDTSTTDDPGGRLIQMVLRINF
jgi:hypothetical protein